MTLMDDSDGRYLSQSEYVEELKDRIWYIEHDETIREQPPSRRHYTRLAGERHSSSNLYVNNVGSEAPAVQMTRK